MTITAVYLDPKKSVTEVLPTGLSENITHTLEDGAIFEWEFENIFLGAAL